MSIESRVNLWTGQVIGYGFGALHYAPSSRVALVDTAGLAVTGLVVLFLAPALWRRFPYRLRVERAA